MHVFLSFITIVVGEGVAKCVRVRYLGRWEVQYNEIVLCSLINVCVAYPSILKQDIFHKIQ